MEWNIEDMQLNNNNDLYMQYDQSQQSMDTFFNDEELALLFGDDFPSPSIEGNNNNISKVPSNVSLSSLSNEQFSPPNSEIVLENPVGLPREDRPNNKDSKQEDGNGKRKRKREPSQVYDHIMAERKRRELLAQLFIALSAILPGLKKVDKTSVLGEAIKHMQHLKEKVKTLEEAVAKQNVESLVFVKRSKLVVDVDDNDSSCTTDNNNCASGCHSGGDGDASDSLPEIEVKVSNKTILIRLCCEKRKGILSKIYAEVEKHDTIILHSNIAPFGLSTFNVTIVAKTERTEKKHVKNLVKSLHSIIRAY